MSRIQELKEQIKELALEKDQLEQKAYDEGVAKLAKEVEGQCFVYRRNSYSCPSKPLDYWDVFRQVLVIDRSGATAEVVFRECYIDSHGEAVLKRGTSWISHTYRTLFNEGWAPCEISEFRRNWKRVADRIDGRMA